MKIKYTSVTGEIHEIEVSEEWEEIILDLDRKEYNINRKETRRHTSLDTYDYIDGQADTNPCLSRDAFEFRNGICSESAEMAADLESKYTRQHIRNAVDKLKPKQRKLITAIYFDEVSVNDYAKREGVDHSAISHRLHTAYTALKKLL
jgi:RNA polymerase sigma-70 factor (ECF subfamily)